MDMSHTHQSPRRVVITGVGIVSPIGIGVEAFGASLAAGRSGVVPLTLHSSSGAPGNVGAEVRGFTDESAKKTYLSSKEQRKSLKVMCREIQLGAASANLAVGDSRLDLDAVDHQRFGVDFGANLMFSPPEVLADAVRQCTDYGLAEPFQYDAWGGTGLPAMEPLWLLRYLPNMPACHIGISADARGPSNSITLEEASGNLALAEATRIIQRDRADVMIAGTTGTRVHSVKSMHAALWDELASSDGPPETWSRPFDLHRNGQVLGEGACSLILEEESHAKARGATIYGTVLGGGSSCVLGRDGIPGLRQAFANAMRAALRDAGLSPGDVGHINAHGLSTVVCDRAEAEAIGAVFGAAAPRIPVTALKSYFGNTGASCGTVELAGALAGLRKWIIPATLNYSTPDPACPLHVVHGQAAAPANGVVMKLSITRVGQASVIVVAAPQP